MAKRRKKMSSKVQWTLASILIVAFVLILAWRFSQLRKTEPEGIEVAVASVIAPSESSESSLSVAELRALIEGVKASRVEWDRAAEPPRTVSLDPFHAPESLLIKSQDELLAGTEAAEGEEGDLENAAGLEEPGPSRDEILATTVLSGVFRTDTWSAAVINGQYVPVGDVVGGFLVKQVLDYEVILEDEEGQEVIQLSEPPWLSIMDFQGMGSDPPGDSEL